MLCINNRYRPTVLFMRILFTPTALFVIGFVLVCTRKHVRSAISYTNLEIALEALVI